MKQLTKSRIISMVIVLSILISIHPQALWAKQIVKVGSYQDPPAIWIDKDQSVKGFIPDILDHIAGQEDWQIEYVPINWCDSVQALVDQNVDLLPGAYPVLNSNNDITLSESPVYLDWGQVYTKDKNEIQTVLDLEGKRVAVENSCIFSEGESGLKELASQFNVNIEFYGFTDATKALQDLYDDKVDAIVLGRFYYNIPEMHSDIVKTSILLNPVTIYFGAQKNQYAPYLNVIDAHIRELKANRSSIYYQSWDKWFSRSLGGHLPTWLLHLATTLGGLTLLLIGFSLFARHQVEKKTREISDKNDRLRSLSMELTLAEEDERRRLAELLHDNLGQNLALTKIRLSAMEQSAKADNCLSNRGDIKQFLNEAISVTRTLTTEMSPPALYNLTFIAAIKWLAESILRGNNIDVDVIGNGQEIQLPEPAKVLLFKTVRELLVNIVKHAQAGYVKIELKVVNDSLSMTIHDNGIGLAACQSNGETKKDGFGLLNIRERLTYLGGQFEINSNQGQGTTARLQIPVNLELKRGT
jgi:signal transduction histidine kinase